MGDVAKDLAAGTAGGAAQLICGHPFDTIKVKLQSQPAPLPGQVPKFSGAMDAVRQTLASEGPRGLYKGMGAPLATVAALNAVLFSVRGQIESFFRPYPGASLQVHQQVICGAGAGTAVSLLACPTELIKCRFAQPFLKLCKLFDFPRTRNFTRHYNLHFFFLVKEQTASSECIGNIQFRWCGSEVWRSS